MTTFSLLWLADVLRAAKLTVVETPGWQSRGHGDVRDILGVMCHHTCGPLHGDIADLHVLIEGRSDLPGPLCELGLARSGTFHVVCAGKPWHAGKGIWRGVTDGNAHFIGIEAENTGLSNDPWPEVQMEAYQRGVAALLQHVGAQPNMCCGHKEYALPHGRKNDPDFDMNDFREKVGAFMGIAPPAWPKAGVVLVDGLNVRSSPNAKAPIMRSLSKGQAVSITGQAKNAETTWLQVAGGYAAAHFIATT
jgi:hypothetical protein